MVDELVRAAAGGDEDAFAQLVALHEKKVYNLALRMCGDPEDAWDAAQEAFLSAWRGLPSFRGEAGFSTWLYRLTSNAAIDLLRRNRRQRGEASLDDENLGIDAVDRAPSPQEQAEAAELPERAGEPEGRAGRCSRLCALCGTRRCRYPGGAERRRGRDRSRRVPQAAHGQR